MKRHRLAAPLLAAAVATSAGVPAAAQMHHHAAATDTVRAHSTPSEHPQMDMHAMHEHTMTGAFGPYSMTREASGTAWQPDAAPHRGVHASAGAWTAMLHGMADVVADHQNGPRGDQQLYSGNMIMGTAQRPAGPGTFGLRTMLSLEPTTIGTNGYPLLLQTGETADGVTPLVDRQHPHDLFMELAGSYSVSRDANAVFVYAGLPGEPALGPPSFMHRFSGSSIPQSPITHHWLDSTHITYGVVTGGVVVDRVKLEASAFRGREPDEHRWNIETPKLDSHSFRVSFNPAPSWALQLSYGELYSPEQLEPEVDQDRTTLSAMYDVRWPGGLFETTLAWGRNVDRPGYTLDGLLAEAAVETGGSHTVFVRVERVQKDDVVLPPSDGSPFVIPVVLVGELTAGYRFDVWKTEHISSGIGVLGSLAFVPHELREAYGPTPGGVSVFARLGLE